ncbi:MAG: hypothetical protein K8F91_26105, partial [Candidatus Obscuribacterales bacterium]|nr:hypothetical protein [Candidatus Obscuribacterales bacterium]
MGNFRKPLNTQELKSYARQNNIEIASTTALSNCGVLRPPANTGALKSDETENCLIDDESEGFQYFAGPREGRTYTAELRFRNQFEFEDTGNRPKAEKPLTGEWNTVKDFSLKAA